MTTKTFGSAAVAAVVLMAVTIGSVTPAAAWCRWGRCGWGGPLAAGLVAGAVVGAAAAAAAGPGPYYYGRPGGYFVCPPGYHWGPHRRSCWAN